MTSKVQMAQQAAFSVAMFCFKLLIGTSPFAWIDPSTGLSSSGDGLSLLRDGKCPLIGTELRMSDQAFRAFSWLSWGVKRVFLRMFINGYSHPEDRPSLDDIVFALKAQLAVYEKDTRADRLAVIPTSVKESEDFRA